MHPTTLGHPFWAVPKLLSSTPLLKDILPSPSWLRPLSGVCITLLTSKQSPQCCPLNPQLVNTEVGLFLLSFLTSFWRRTW